MFCQRCGTQYGETAQFCGKCGAPRPGQVAQPQQQQQPPYYPQGYQQPLPPQSQQKPRPVPPPPGANITGRPPAQPPARPPQQAQPPQGYQQPGQPYYPPQQQGQPYYPQQPQQPVQPIQVNVGVSQSTTVVNKVQLLGRQKPSMLVRLLYFCFIGFWFGPLWLICALLLCCTVVFAPIGIVMLAKTGWAFFL